MITIISLSVLLFVMWVIFADTRKYTGKEYHPIVQALAHLWGVIFGVLDVVYNQTLGILIFDICFGHWPSFHGWTLSERLRWLLAHDDKFSTTWTRRWKFAYWVCRKAISPWDYNHCRMGLGG